MIQHSEAALAILNSAAADAGFVLNQSVIATSILFLIFSCIMYGMCLWHTMLEVEMDIVGGWWWWGGV